MIHPTTLTLYTETPHGVFDALGEHTRVVYADVADVGMNEFYAGLSAGLAPEIAFEIPMYTDYKGEKRLEYQGVLYKVIRATRRGQRERLVCEKVDVNE